MERILKELTKIQGQNGWSDSRLAQELGTVPSSLSRYKSGQREPNLDFIKGVARLAQTNPHLHVALYEYLTA